MYLRDIFSTTLDVSRKSERRIHRVSPSPPDDLAAMPLTPDLFHQMFQRPANHRRATALQHHRQSPRAPWVTARSASEPRSPAPSYWNWSANSPRTCTCRDCAASRSRRICGCRRSRWRSGSKIAGSSIRRRTCRPARTKSVAVWGLAANGRIVATRSRSDGSASRRTTRRRPRRAARMANLVAIPPRPSDRSVARKRATKRSLTLRE